MDETKLGNKIRERRKELRMSQKALAKAVGLIQAKISQIEIGERRIDMLRELPLFAEALGKPVEWFITDQEARKDQVTLESVIREKCPSLGNLTNEDLAYLKDLLGKVFVPILETDHHFINKRKKAGGARG